MMNYIYDDTDDSIQDTQSQVMRRRITDSTRIWSDDAAGINNDLTWPKKINPAMMIRFISADPLIVTDRHRHHFTVEDRPWVTSQRSRNWPGLARCGLVSYSYHYRLFRWNRTVTTRAFRYPARSEWDPGQDPRVPNCSTISNSRWIGKQARTNSGILAGSVSKPVSIGPDERPCQFGVQVSSAAGPRGIGITSRAGSRPVWAVLCLPCATVVRRCDADSRGTESNMTREIEELIRCACVACAALPRSK